MPAMRGVRSRFARASKTMGPGLHSAASDRALLADRHSRRYGWRATCRRGFGQMLAFIRLVDTVISIYIWLLIAQAVLSWLVAFGVVNRHNRGVAMVGDF